MPEKPSSARILLALDISPRSRAALEMAATLAAELDVELAGLFVEDVDLLRLGGLPFTREVGFLSCVSRPIGLEEVEQALRREGEEVRRLLAEAAARQSLRWSYRVARGRIATELFALAGEPDLIVLGKRARLGFRPLAPSLAAGECRPGAAGPVVAVFDGTPEARRALELAGGLARASCAELRLLVPAATDEAFFRLAAEAKTLLARAKAAAPACRRIVSGDIAELARAAREADAGVLVIVGDGRFRGGEGFATLLNEIDCPVVLAG
ncbi:MAG TPA: universal stress protein [Methylococcaceae bacterium]|nr:universal stress protein [Methylococcaceae bacterium]